MSLSFSAVSITFSVVRGLAGILTLIRLGFRLKIQRLWWEDLWAAFAFLCTFISIITVLSVSGTSKNEPINIASKVDAYMFTCIVWSVRLSLIFSVIRITYTRLQRRITLAIACFFAVFWATTISFQAWRCANDTRIIFPGAEHPFCVLPRFMIITEVAMNCSADTASVIFPLRLLWRVKLPPRQRRMVLSLFTTSRFLCLFSLAHAIAQLIAPPTIQGILANIQLGAFLIVCNLLVVITYFYRSFQSLRSSSGDSSSVPDPSDDDFTAPAPRDETSPQDLTTVDLESLRTSISGSTNELKADLFPSIVPEIKASETGL